MVQHDLHPGVLPLVVSNAGVDGLSGGWTLSLYVKQIQFLVAVTVLALPFIEMLRAADLHAVFCVQTALFRRFSALRGFVVEVDRVNRVGVRTKLRLVY